MRLVRTALKEQYEAELESYAENLLRVRLANDSLSLHVAELADGSLLVCDARSRWRAFAYRVGSSIMVAVGPYVFTFVEDKGSEERRRSVETGSTQIVAPMPGRVVKIMVEEGATVLKGHPLLVLEAMKMELVLRAEFAARVAKLHASVGAQVDAGALLIELNPEPLAPPA